MKTGTMKLILISLLCALGVAIGQASAHGAGGHGSTIHAEEAIDLATRYVTTMVKRQTSIDGETLDASWQQIPATDKAVDRQGSWYYIVKVHHAEANKTLYMLISMKGKLYRANFNGSFKGLED